MIMAYYRLGKYEDARRSMKRLLDFARRFRLDNPLVKFGSDVYQPGEPINITYDAFGPPAAMVRGLFEYLYRADGLMLIPHIPAGITELHQRFPVRLGKKRLYLSAVGQGSVRRVLVNGRDWQWHDEASVFLPEGHTPEEATIQVILGDAKPTRVPKPAVPVPAKAVLSEFAKVSAPASLAPLRERVSTFVLFLQRLEQAGLAQTYEGAHAQLILRQWLTVLRRAELQNTGKLARLPEPSQTAADKSYVDTLTKLCDGLEKVLDGYADSRSAGKQRITEIWQGVKKG